MLTKDIIEGLLYVNPSLYLPLYSLNVISDDRVVSPKQHPEYEKFLSQFTSPIFFTTINLTEQVLIVQINKEGKRSKTAVLIINGNNTEFQMKTKEFIYRQLTYHLIAKDFLPEAFCRKLVCITDYSNGELDGICLSEYKKNAWTFDDPMKIELNKKVKIAAGKELCRSVVNEIFHIYWEDDN